MRALIQRVVKARVTVHGSSIGEIGSGIVIMLGIAKDDGEDESRNGTNQVRLIRKNFKCFQKFRYL